MLEAEHNIQYSKNLACWCLELTHLSLFKLYGVLPFLGATDSPASLASELPILCFLLHKAKNLLICSNAICLAAKAFNIHSYPGLHTYISLPGEMEEIFVF